jgi:hypothetical protein
VEKYGRGRPATDDNITRRMRFSCWITKATDTHLEYVILIAFPRQQWLHESTSVLHLYVHCLSLTKAIISSHHQPDDGFSTKPKYCSPLKLCRLLEKVLRFILDKIRACHTPGLLLNFSLVFLSSNVTLHSTNSCHTV